MPNVLDLRPSLEFIAALGAAAAALVYLAQRFVRPAIRSARKVWHTLEAMPVVVEQMPLLCERVGKLEQRTERQLENGHPESPPLRELVQDIHTRLEHGDRRFAGVEATLDQLVGFHEADLRRLRARGGQ